ncbi:MAG: ACT domain-containing protein [Candidatus Omnitrophota bacterium]|jgi:hypothetical protein|nr:MAG: ACT domain-containing protein [Candidatus Omnitrophota bacterium]
MKLRQISVFVENRTGRVAEVTRLLGKGGINIRVVSLADTHDFGIIRLIVNDVDKALQILRDNQFTALDTEVVAVEIPDEPGGLAKILEYLGHNNVNIEYLYGFVERPGEQAILIFRFEELDHAVRVLTEQGAKILSGKQLYEL